VSGPATHSKERQLGQHLTLKASDGHELGAYRADPAGQPKGGVVVIQEIFGVNSHIRNLCDRLAAEGYVAVAPAIFDRHQRDFQSGYSPDEVAEARKFIPQLNWDNVMKDTQAAVDLLRKEGKVAIVGFCLGGTVAFLGATRVPGLSAAVGFYGGRIVGFADEKPQCPTQLHFGEEDQGIPLTDVETIKQKRPEVEVYVYPGAGHGFNCDERASYNAESAKLAWGRTLDFLKKGFADA
jgi:carboxymethylenebutenolidase